MAKQDPYMLDTKAQAEIQNETKLASQGVLCPKRNRSINKPCAVCDAVSVLFNTGDKQDKEVAYLKMAKANYYFNVVFPSDPSKIVLLEMGKKAGSIILDGITLQGWVDIAHPKAKLGREMLITKKISDKRNSYHPAPVLQNADWDVPDEVLQNIPNLDNILEILEAKPDNLYKISQLKVDETLRFRILPPWDNGNGNKRIAAVVWRHWGGVTQEEVDGLVAVNTTMPEEKDPAEAKKEEKPPWEEPSEAKPEPSPEVPKEGSKDKPDVPCLGNANLFDSEDPECKKCWQYKKCGRLVAKK
jgi:hypothetical protein